MATVRYIVHDVEAAVAFYTSHLGFSLRQQFGPAMAVLVRDDLELWCAGPSSSAGKPMADGRKPTAGGWARIVVAVPAIDDHVERLRRAGVTCRSDIVSGPGGRQILIEDPSGNPIELFEARA